jgi:type I restriction enzyme, S subunit
MRDGWFACSLKDVAKVAKGKLPKIKNDTGVGLPYLTASYLRTNKPDFWVEDCEGSLTADRGDCLILWDGAGAGDLFSAEPGVVSSTMALVKLQDHRVNRDYLTLAISSQSSYIKETCRGTTVPHVSPHAIANMKLSIPPLSQQKRIVDLMAAVDAYIETLQHQLDNAKRCRGGLLCDLLTAGGEGWVDATLGDFADVVGGGTPSTSIPENWDGDIIWLTPTEVTSQDGKILTDSIRKISEQGLKSSGAQMLPKGSVILTSRASVGFVAISGVELCTNQGFQSLIPKESVLAEFLMYWIQNNRLEFESRSAGSTFKEISKSNVKSIKICVPPIPEQQRIVDLISSIDELTNRIESNLSATKTFRSALLTELLSGKHVIPATYDELIGAA